MTSNAVFSNCDLLCLCELWLSEEKRKWPDADMLPQILWERKSEDELDFDTGDLFVFHFLPSLSVGVFNHDCNLLKQAVSLLLNAKSLTKSLKAGLRSWRADSRDKSVHSCTAQPQLQVGWKTCRHRGNLFTPCSLSQPTHLNSRCVTRGQLSACCRSQKGVWRGFRHCVALEGNGKKSSASLKDLQ